MCLIGTSALSPAVVAADATATKDATERTTDAVHLSPQATEGPKPARITPPKPEEVTAAIERGVKYLLADQRPDGSWGSPENTKSMNIYAPPPGAHDAFRTAVTSLVVMSLIEVEPHVAESERA